MNEPVLLGDILRGQIARLLAPAAPRSVLDPTRLGIPRQPLDQLTRRSVLIRDGYRCVWCSASYARDRSVVFEVDHIVPWIAGGSDHPVNLRTLCQDCNQLRSNRVTELDVRALPIVWRCYSCDEWGDIDLFGPALITAFCSTCRHVQQDVPYVADLMIGGEVPTAGVPAVRDGDQDLNKIPVTARLPGRRFRDRREHHDKRRAAARAELDAIRPARLAALLPDVLDRLAETTATERVHTRHTTEGTIMDEKPQPDEARNDELLTFQAQVCRGCVAGTPGECHVPGCFYWLHSIDEVPHDVLFAYVVEDRLAETCTTHAATRHNEEESDRG